MTGEGSGSHCRQADKLSTRGRIRLAPRAPPIPYTYTAQADARIGAFSMVRGSDDERNNERRQGPYASTKVDDAASASGTTSRGRAADLAAVPSARLMNLEEQQQSEQPLLPLLSPSVGDLSATSQIHLAELGLLAMAIVPWLLMVGLVLLLVGAW